MRIALDSNVFIYVLGQSSTWSEPAIAILRQLEDGRATGVASVICLSEVLTYPFGISEAMGEDAQLFMEGLEGIDYTPVNEEVAIQAARLRAQYGAKLSTSDAIHLASAVVERADVFVTNDHALLKLKLDGLRIHLLGEPLPKA